MSQNPGFDLSAARAKADVLQVVQNALWQVIRSGGYLPDSDDPDSPISSFHDLVVEYGKFTLSEAAVAEAIGLIAPHFPELSHVFAGAPAT